MRAWALRAAPIVALVLLAAPGCGGSGHQGTGAGSQPASMQTGSTGDSGPGANTTGPAPSTTTTSGGDRFNEDAGDVGAAMTAAVRRYVAAVDRHDGSGVCAALVPGALQALRFPTGREACAKAMSAAIGHSVRGGPAWRRTRIVRIRRVEIDPEHSGEGRVEATVVHTFRGNRQPSVEDDLVYLTRAGGRWLLVQPSATLYRAIGYRTPPLSSLVPPAP